jgi:hypothetical protein
MLAPVKGEAVKSLLDFVSFPRKPGQLTSVWAVASKAGVSLGAVSWFSPWRRYVFRPTCGTVLEASSLREVADFVERETSARKAPRKSA